MATKIGHGLVPQYWDMAPHQPLRIVPTLRTPPAVPPVRLGPLFSGFGLALGILWSGKSAYEAIRAVPKQLPWMPNSHVDPAILSDPQRAAEKAKNLFGHIDTPHLYQLHYVREKQSILSSRIDDPFERSLMIVDDQGDWVQIPLDGQASGDLLLSSLFVSGFERQPLHVRADIEKRLIEVELKRRGLPGEAPKKKPGKSLFERYVEYIQQLLEALRKKENGEPFILPTFLLNDEHIIPHNEPFRRRQAVNSSASQKTGNASKLSGLSMDKELVARRYDEYAGDYEGHSIKMKANMGETVAEYLNPYVRQGTHLLDVAGGDGLATQLLDNTKVKVTIIDLSGGMLEAAQKKRPNVVDVKIADFDNNLPFADETFDYATCISALEFARDLEFTLREMFRVTKREGLILFTSDRLDSYSAAQSIQHDEYYIHDPKGFFSRRYSTDAIRRLVKKFGGSIVRHGVHNAYSLENQWVRYDYFLVRK